MQKSMLLPAFVIGYVCGAEPRFLTQVEDVRPLLQQYSQDPFRYPGIWSLEAKDPFELDLKALAQAPVQQGPKPMLASQPSLGGIRPSSQGFLKKLGSLQSRESMVKSASTENEASPSERYSPDAVAEAGAGEPRYLRPYLIATAPFLAQVGLRGKVFPGEAALRYRSSNESEVLQPMEEIEMAVAGDASVKAGDLYKTYEVGDSYRSFRTSRNLGRLVEVNGLAEVTRVGSGYAVARLVRCFGRVSRRSRVAPMGELAAVRAGGYSQTAGPLRVGRVVWVTPPHQIPQPFSQAIIDGGSQDGFQVGDFIIFLDRRNGKMTDRVLGNAVILRADGHSSTLLLQDVHPGVINPGDFAVAHLSPTP